MFTPFTLTPKPRLCACANVRSADEQRVLCQKTPTGTKILNAGKAVLNLNKLFPAHFYKQKVIKKINKTQKITHQKKCYVVLHFWQGQKAAGI